MSWTGLPATETTDWTGADFRRQFALAIHERRVAVGDIPHPPEQPYDDVEGWDVQIISGHDLAIATMQQTVESLVDEFLRPGSYVGVAEPPTAYKMSEFWADVGVPAEGRPSEDIRAMTTPPYSPQPSAVVGERIAVVKPATSDFTGHDGQIATCTGTDPYTWSFSTPVDGYLIAQRGWSSLRKKWTFVGYRRRDASVADWPNEYPAVAGFTRKHPREIESLDDEGEAGQRARLLGTGNLNPTWTRFCGVAADPPEHPLDGAHYGVQASATGAWNGHDGELARRVGAAWQFTAVADGDQYMFNAIRSLDGTMKPLRGARAWLQHGGQWHPVGAFYEHDGAGWALAEDQDAGPDLITTYGHARAGDYVGPWVWNELQAAIQQLHVIKASSSSWGGLAALKQAGVSEWHDTWGDAKTDCMANWVGGDPPEESSEGWSYPGPTCYNLSYHTGWGYSATMHRLHRKQRLLFQAGDPPIKCDVRFYIIGAALDFGEEINEFDAMGDDIAQTASLWREDSGVSNAGEFISPLWEAARTNVPPQPWCADPTGTSDEPLTTMGYVTETSFGVKELAVVDGFEYR